MTPEAQRIAIAEACGWTRVIEKRGSLWQGERTDGSVGLIPDYLGWLDAMHEAEKVLCEDAQTVFAEMLSGSLWDVAHATAAQRAEAFLRATGKWKEAADV